MTTTPHKHDTRSLAARLWLFQTERAPLLPMVLMAVVTVGVMYKFSQAPVWYFAVASLIVVLYLIQIRASDERKDFEHDNKYHPDRPVQRGLITLDELLLVNRTAVLLQLVLYASFLDLRVFAWGLLSQGYAFLTRKEFFVRPWIRRHFFVYHFSHWFQMIILSLALLAILEPAVPYWQLISLIMLNIISVEVARKMLASQDDTTDDTFSAQLGHTGSAWTLSLLAIAITGMSSCLILQNAQNILFIMLPVIATGAVLNSAYHYAIEPNRTNSRYIDLAAGFLLLASMLSVILGA